MGGTGLDLPQGRLVSRNWSMWSFLDRLSGFWIGPLPKNRLSIEDTESETLYTIDIDVRMHVSIDRFELLVCG